MIRKGVVEDSSSLTDLARAAKASWGDPEAWLREWEPELTITPEFIRCNAVFVAESEGRIAGMVSIEEGPEGPEIGHLWVDPGGHGEGWGRRLLETAIEFAAANHWTALRILSDPNAVPFYRKFGAVPVSDVAAPVAGTERRLPVLRLPVTG